ncbi:hypothetical protein C7E12_19900, partial [Stenotrophomonas maltophilia]
RGNLAVDGCVVKTAGVDESIHVFEGPARVYESPGRRRRRHLDRAEGCIRSLQHAYSLEGGLAVLRGNLAVDGCVVKTAGVDESIHVFEGPARVYES